MWGVVGLAGVVCIGLGAGVGLVMAPAPSPEVLATPDGPDVVAVSERTFNDPRTMQVVPEVASQWTATSLASGTVRRYDCQPGVPIRSGSTVLLVDDRPVLALHLSSPPWRDMAVGVRGDDVLALQQELATMGLDVNQDGNFGRQVSTAVEATWRAAGVAGRMTSLPLDRLIWLSEPEVIPSTCPLEIGQQLEPGTALFTVGGGIAGLAVTKPEQAMEGERVVTLDELSIPLPDDSVIRDPAFLTAFAATSQYEQSRQGGASATLSVQTELATPIPVVAVPPSALYDTSGGQACLLAPESPIPVEVVASQLGEVMVTAENLPAEVTTHPGPHPAPCR